MKRGNENLEDENRRLRRAEKIGKREDEIRKRGGGRDRGRERFRREGRLRDAGREEEMRN